VSWWWWERKGASFSKNVRAQNSKMSGSKTMHLWRRWRAWINPGTADSIGTPATKPTINKERESSNASPKMTITKVIRRITKILHESHHTASNSQRGIGLLLEKIHYQERWSMSLVGVKKSRKLKWRRR